jgi:N-acetylmuramoyl-L-alanine amidase
MPNKLHVLVIHCTATPAGRNVSSDEIRQWHLGPAVTDKGVRYRGKTYTALSALPPDKIGGVSVYKLKGRGWSQVGYSDMIHLDGRIENLVPYNADDVVDPWEITNGILRSSDKYLTSRHVVYVGGCEKGNPQKAEDTRTEAQLKALFAYVMRTIQAVPAIRISGHNQFDTKACPSFDVPAWCKSVGIADKNIYKP